jgi:hypothetical protein
MYLKLKIIKIAAMIPAYMPPNKWIDLESIFLINTWIKMAELTRKEKIDRLMKNPDTCMLYSPFLQVFDKEYKNPTNCLIIRLIILNNNIVFGGEI